MVKVRKVSANVVVVIPAYNEAQRIVKVITSIPKEIKTREGDYKTSIVVVADGSKDTTATVAKSAGAHVIRHIFNSGAGAATRTGLRYAQMLEGVSYVVTIDADGQHSGSDIERIVKFAIKHKAKMVIGNRLHKGNDHDMPAHRAYGNVLLSFISRLLFGIKTKDTQSGMRLFSTDIIAAISDYSLDRYGFCTEMLWVARSNDIEVLEMPISVVYSKELLRKGQNSWGVVDLLRDLLWVRISR